VLGCKSYSFLDVHRDDTLGAMTKPAVWVRLKRARAEEDAACPPPGPDLREPDTEAAQGAPLVVQRRDEDGLWTCVLGQQTAHDAERGTWSANWQGTTYTITERCPGVTAVPGFDATADLHLRQARGGFAPSGPQWGLRPQTPAL
jgi:hypothetical protein